MDLTFLSESTYFVYYDIRKLGPDYARLMLKATMTDIVKEVYRSKGLDHEFYQQGMAEKLDDHWNKMTYLGNYPPSVNVDQAVFIQKQGIKAERIVFMVGDTVLAKLGKEPHVKTSILDMVFDMMGSQSDPDIPTMVFGNEDYSVNLITLKEDTDIRIC